MRLPYKLGDVFAFPLRGEGGFCVGVIAGMPEDGKVLLGYFYEKIYAHIPSKTEVADLKPHDALRIWRFGDLSLVNKEWPIVGRIAAFNLTEWPSPKFFRESMLQLITYANSDPLRKTQVEPYLDNGERYERDDIYGAGAVEIAMTNIVNSG